MHGSEWIDTGVDSSGVASECEQHSRTSSDSFDKVMDSLCSNENSHDNNEIGNLDNSIGGGRAPGTRRADEKLNK